MLFFMISIKLSENGGKAPEAVPYMPAGRHLITATVNGEPRTREVIVDRAACERLQRDLEEFIRASDAGERARPMLMFDHQAGAAAAKPLGFEWDEERGVLLRVEWTQAGRAAVEGGNYAYISPAFQRDRMTGSVAGLSRSTIEVGSLVNDPAFQRTECIAAARADEPETEEIQAAFLPPREEIAEGEGCCDNSTEEADAVVGSEPQEEETPMLDEIKELLGLDPAATEADICAAISALKEKDQENLNKIEQVEAESEKHQQALQEHKEAAADAFIERQKQAGTIAPKDDERIQAARSLYMSDPKGTELIYAGMRRKANFAEDFSEEDVKASNVQPTETQSMTLEELLGIY